MPNKMFFTVKNCTLDRPDADYSILNIAVTLIEQSLYIAVC